MYDEIATSGQLSHVRFIVMANLTRTKGRVVDSRIMVLQPDSVVWDYLRTQMAPVCQRYTHITNDSEKQLITFLYTHSAIRCNWTKLDNDLVVSFGRSRKTGGKSRQRRPVRTDAAL
jgi:hypothetical protein